MHGKPLNAGEGGIENTDTVKLKGRIAYRTTKNCFGSFFLYVEKKQVIHLDKQVVCRKNENLKLAVL